MIKQNLTSFHIIERESKQNLITWTYPTITAEIKNYITSRCFPVTRPVESGLFFYLRKNNFWIYIKQFIKNNKTQGAVTVIAEDLVPTKYKVFCDILIKKYIKTNNPVDLVKLYLKLIISGSVSYQENGTEVSLNLKNDSEETKIKDLIRIFGVETILIHNAILLRRRILVYHNDIEKLQQKMESMANLVSNINPNLYLQPLIEDVNELKSHTFYLAGTTEDGMSNNERYYDLSVNLPRSEIKISTKTKESFSMTKIHKDLAHYMVELSESDLNEKRVIEEIRNKTDNILELLKSLATCVVENKKMISINDLKSKKFNPSMENFLFNLAVAENIMML